MEIVGDFEYNSKDLIGHGAFAVVFKGRYRNVSYCDFIPPIALWFNKMLSSVVIYSYELSNLERIFCFVMFGMGLFILLNRNMNNVTGIYVYFCACIYITHSIFSFAIFFFI